MCDGMYVEFLYLEGYMVFDLINFVDVVKFMDVDFLFGIVK